MAETLREIKNRIRGVGNVNKITHAMEMISIAKLRPVKAQLANAKPYFAEIERLFKSMLQAEGAVINHPLFEKRPEVKKIAVCVVTSDTGLCSNYNSAVIRAADEFMQKFGKDKVILVSLGRKGANYFRRRGIESALLLAELKGRYSQEACTKVLQTLMELFLSGQADEVYVAYTDFQTSSRRRPVVEKFLNLAPEAGRTTKYIFEPGFETIFAELVPEYLSQRMKLMMLNSYTTEHSARVIAMGAATKNAVNLLDDLVLLRNKVRQANITKEILEIISSVEVMR